MEEQKNTDNQSNEHSPSPPSTPLSTPDSTQQSKKGGNIFLFIIIVIIVTFILTATVVGGSVFLYFHLADGSQTEMMDNKNDKKDEKQIEKDDKSNQDKDNNSDKKPKPDVEPDENNTDPNKSSTLTTVDSTWNLYTNYKYGFSIKLPKQIYDYNVAPCDWDGDSYRPTSGFVPLKAFEDDHVFFAGEYYYKLAGETIVDFTSYYSECNFTEVDLGLLNSSDFWQPHWELVFADANNDAELETFIKNRYGAGCELGDKKTTGQSDVFDVDVKSDGLPLDQTICPLNYATKIMYNQKNNQIVAWDLGQAVSFAGDDSWQTAYDGDMVDSFRFLD